MSCRLILEPSFPLLQDRLWEELQRSCCEDPVGVRWLITPTSTSANHMRLRLGQEAGRVAAGIRVIPISAFLRRLAGWVRPGRGGRWEPALDLFLFGLVEALETGSPLAGLRDMPSGYRLLRPTFLDLADAGFGVEQVDLLEELAAEPELAPIEQATLGLYTRWLRALAEQNFGWEPLVHQGIPEWIVQAGEETLSTALGCEPGRTPKLFVYGFYDFTDVNAQVIAALGRRLEVSIFYPFAGADRSPHPAFAFGSSVLDDLKVRLGTALKGIESRDGSREAAAHETTRFFRATFPEGEITGQPGFLTFQKASGIRAEVLSAAVRVRSWMDAETERLEPEEVMVIAPDVRAYVDAVREIFAAFAIPLSIIDAPVSLTPERRPLQMLARVWEERASAEWILAYLREYPAVPIMAKVSIDHFESKIRRLGLWGSSNWKFILEVDSNRPGIQERALPEFTAPERHLIERIIATWIEALEPQGRYFTPAQALEFLSRVREDWLPDSAPAETLLQAIALVEQTHAKLQIPESLLRELFLQPAIEQIQTDSLYRRAVRFLPVMRARGLTAKGIVLLGLSSGTLPARIEEDPLFSDASRLRLVRKAQEVGHRVPLKSTATDEMAMLFFLLNTSAERVHWTIPETDNLGRSVAPTPWVQRYIQRWEAAPQPMWSRIARGPIQQAEYLHQLDETAGAMLPPEFLLFIRPEAARLAAGSIPYEYLMGASRRRQRDLSRNGHIPAAAFPLKSPGKSRLRVTDVEAAARCPYRFYAGRLMDWRPLVPLRLAEEMSALERGQILHAFLESLIQPFLEHRAPLSNIAGHFLEDGRSRLEEAARELEHAFPIRFGILPPVFREAALARLVNSVAGYFQEVIADKCTDRVPIQLESRAEAPFPGLEGVSVSGRVDRIDAVNGGFHIYDYKSGGAPRKSQLGIDVSAGYRAQPLLYPWLFEVTTAEAAGASFSYVFLGETPPKEIVCGSPDSVEKFLRSFAEMLEQGMYLATPAESLRLVQIDKVNPCQYCDYLSLCRKFDPGARSRYFDLYRRHLSARLDNLIESIGEEEK